MSRDTKPPDEFMIMRQLYDNLEYLDYEVEFDPIKRHLPYLTPIYFAFESQSTKEQFDYFSSLAIWMMRTFLGSQVEEPTEFSAPADVADSILIALHDIGFKISFPSTKLLPGHGIAVCSILDSLAKKALKAKGFAHHKFRVVDPGNSANDDNVQTIGEEDSDEEGIVDDVEEYHEDESFVETPIYDSNVNAPQVIDSLALKSEAERVAPRLQIHISASKTDWRTHFQQMTTYQTQILDLMSKLTPILQTVGMDVTKAIDSITTREKNLNSRFQTTVVEYATRAGSLSTIEAKHKARTEEVNALQEELNQTAAKLKKVQTDLEIKQREMSDNSPLMKLKKGIEDLREKKKQLQLQSAILQRSLTKAWLDEKDREIEAFQ